MSDPFELFLCSGCGGEIDEDTAEEFNGYCSECYEIKQIIEEEAAMEEFE